VSFDSVQSQLFPVCIYQLWVLYFSLPDMSAIQSKELEIPTLSFYSGQHQLSVDQLCIDQMLFFFSLPDMSAIQSKELEIPTLSFDSGQLSSK
jgi:hypothetical protein